MRHPRGARRVYAFVGPPPDFAVALSRKAVFLGGRDHALGERIKAALHREGFDVRKHDDLPGMDKQNICNRGTSGAGVQLELSNAVRKKTMFESLTREGRSHPTARFDAFVAAVRGVLDQA